MNILFLYSSVIDPERGGVQRVTSVLADEFSRRGGDIYYVSLPVGSGDSGRASPRQFYLPSKEFCCEENIRFFKAFLRAKKIDVVINQGGWSRECSRLSYVSRECGVAVVGVVHNGLLDVPRNYYESHELLWLRGWRRFFCRFLKSRIAKYLLCRLYIRKYRELFRELCGMSDQVVLLSESFKPDLALYFPRRVLPENVSSIANPLTFPVEGVKADEKQKILLWVGRMSYGQKRPDLMLKVWKILESRFPDWSLVFVGDGDYLRDLKALSFKLGLQRVSFEGFQDPRTYYKRASIFCMTSTYEGFPMALVEALSFGCVPVVFNSFPAVRDIVSSGENGILVSSFDCNRYAEACARLMEDRDLRNKLAKQGILSVSKFLSVRIAEEWENLFKKIFSLEK